MCMLRYTVTERLRIKNDIDLLKQVQEVLELK